MRVLLLHPLLIGVLTLVWVLLVNDFSWGAVISGMLIGFVIAGVTSPYWPERLNVRNPLAIVEYLAVVLWDIIVSNVQVAYLVLFRRGVSLRSQFVIVPLALESP